MLISPSDIRTKAERLYPRFLKSVAEGEPFFPCDIPFRKVKANDAFDRVRKDVEALLAGSRQQGKSGYTVEMEAINTRRYGIQHHPKRIAFECEDDFLGYLGKHIEVRQLRSDLDLIDTELSALSDWARLNVLRVVEHGGRWRDLLAVCRYFVDYPRPGLYIRQLPIPVHTKFIEENQGTLRRLLDEILPESAVDTSMSRFEERYGLRYDEPLIRLRLLDLAVSTELGLPLTDLSIPVGEILRLALEGSTVVVTENKMNFLTLPSIENGVGILGMGKAVGLLRHARWLRSCRILYWGDIDAQGFEILSHFRATFPHVESLMMDEVTLQAHAESVAQGTLSSTDNLPHLSLQETRLFRHVAGRTLRLEQEKILQAFAERMIQRALGSGGHAP